MKSNTNSRKSIYVVRYLVKPKRRAQEKTMILLGLVIRPQRRILSLIMINLSGNNEWVNLHVSYTPTHVCTLYTRASQGFTLASLASHGCLENAHYELYILIFYLLILPEGKYMVRDNPSVIYHFKPTKIEQQIIPIWLTKKYFVLKLNWRGYSVFNLWYLNCKFVSIFSSSRQIF